MWPYWLPLCTGLIFSYSIQRIYITYWSHYNHVSLVQQSSLREAHSHKRTTEPHSQHVTVWPWTTVWLCLSSVFALTFFHQYTLFFLDFLLLHLILNNVSYVTTRTLQCVRLNLSQYEVRYVPIPMHFIYFLLVCYVPLFSSPASQDNEYVPSFYVTSL
jgi:hypothetical protein